MNKVGDTIRNRGMLYTVAEIQFSPDSAIPTVILRRNFDHALFWARTNHVTRFSTLNRIWDEAHFALSAFDVLSSQNMSYRRI